MELKDTIELMNSSDYKERFKAEYYQTKIRYDKLHKMITKYEAKTLEFTPSCSIGLLCEQKKNMEQYLHCFEIRAEIEEIELEVGNMKKAVLRELLKSREFKLKVDTDTKEPVIELVKPKKKTKKGDK